MLKKLLPDELYNLLTSLVDVSVIYEIRIRNHLPICVNVNGQYKIVSSSGFARTANEAWIANESMIDYILARATNNSVYSVSNQIRHGFVTFDSGIRIGVCGETVIDDQAIISAGVLMHQFCRVGSLAMVGGGTRFSQNVPPFTTCAREPAAYCGLNIVGLRRRNFGNDVIENIHSTYRIILQSGLQLAEALRKVREEVPSSPEIDYIIDFIESSKRGFVH